MANKLNTNIDIGTQLKEEWLRKQALGDSGASVGTDKHKNHSNNTQKYTSKMLIAAKVAGLLAIMVGGMWYIIVAVPNANVIEQILYVIAFFTFIIVFPLKLARLTGITRPYILGDEIAVRKELAEHEKEYGVDDEEEGWGIDDQYFRNMGYGSDWLYSDD